MQRQAMALGYFFLAVFCVMASAHSFVELRIPLLVAALAALVVGLGYVADPLVAHLRSIPSWLAGMIRLAQQPPTRVPSIADEQHTQ